MFKFVKKIFKVGPSDLPHNPHSEHEQLWYKLGQLEARQLLIIGLTLVLLAKAFA